MTSTVSYCASSGSSIKNKLRRIVVSQGGLSQIVHPGHLVLIKPNFVAPFPHATTSFELLEAIIEEVRECGGRPIIGESSGYEFDTETTFKILGAHEFAKKNHTELINLDTCEFAKVKLSGGLVKEVKISEIALQADVLINVPKLKRHGLTEVTIGIKNLFGLLHRESRRKIHSLGLDRAIFELSRVIKCDLVIVDGSIIAERAVYSNWQQMDLIVGGRDIYAVDMHCCQFLGVDYKEVGHIRLALKEGLARENYHVVHVGKEILETSHKSPMPAVRHSFKTQLRKAGYRSMYLAEIPYAWVTRGKSLVPSAHYHFGIRPKLDPNKCTGCGDCIGVCPVDAIHVPPKRIDSSACMLVRCLKCVQACPESAISIRGYEMPEDLGAISLDKQASHREDT